MSGKITALELQKRNPERVNVYVDDQFVFGLNNLDAARLRVGLVLSEQEIEHLKAKDTAHQAYERAVRYLAPRPRSSAEIRRHLQDKEFDDLVIEQVILRLQEMSYLDDRAFAQFWVKSRNEFNPRGARALQYELRQKGIDNAIIEEVLAEQRPNEQALQAAQKKLRSLRGQDNKTARAKLGGFLTRRGFAYETVRSVLDELLPATGDAEDIFDNEE